MTINRPTPHLPTRRVAVAMPALLSIGVCALVAAAALAVQSWRAMAGPSDRPTGAAATAMTDSRVPAGSGLGERPSEVEELSTVVPGHEVLEEAPATLSTTTTSTSPAR
jgi:hypothetical protein